MNLITCSWICISIKFRESTNCLIESLTLTTSRADDSSWPYSLLTTTLYVPDNSVEAEVIVNFISKPLKEIIISLDALTTVESLYVHTITIIIMKSSIWQQFKSCYSATMYISCVTKYYPAYIFKNIPVPSHSYFSILRCESSNEFDSFTFLDSLKIRLQRIHHVKYYNMIIKEQTFK